MKKITTIILLFLCSFSLKAQTDSANVYFTQDISPEGVMKVFKYIENSVQGKVGIKVHFGEEGNSYFVPASMVEPLCKKLNATLIETNVLYNGKRHFTKSHIQLAKDHGFTFAPIDILDNDGEIELEVKGGKHYKTAKIGKNIDNYETILYFTHFKGHGAAGFGGCIKNASMGMASVSGKMAMHAADIPIANDSKCVGCGMCVSQCPAGAITLNPLTIDSEKCIGCGKCVGACGVRAISISNTEKPILMERLVEYAKPVVEHKNSLYISVIINVSASCDCSNNPRKPFVKDIGILASTDIVAIEKAAHDLVDQAHSCEDAFLKENGVSGKNQIDYAEQLGLGTKKYRLIKID